MESLHFQIGPAQKLYAVNLSIFDGILGCQVWYFLTLRSEMRSDVLLKYAEPE